MSDIMDRLRQMADLFHAEQAPYNLVLHLRAAADEIERLRAGGCARDQSTTQYCAEAAEKDDLIRRMETEFERLRAALEGLLQCPHIADRDIDPAWTEPETEDAIAIARAALEGK